jgi:hypothetical protein
LEEYLHQEKGNQEMEMTAITLAALNKNHVLGDEDLTKTQHHHARTLPKGIYVEDIMSQMRILWSATTISPTIHTDALIDIDIYSPPAIHLEPKSPSTKHIQNNPMSPQQNFIAVQKFLSQQAEDDSDAQYNPPK